MKLFELNQLYSFMDELEKNTLEVLDNSLYGKFQDFEQKHMYAVQEAKKLLLTL